MPIPYCPSQDRPSPPLVHPSWFCPSHVDNFQFEFCSSPSEENLFRNECLRLSYHPNVVSILYSSQVENLRANELPIFSELQNPHKSRSGKKEQKRIVPGGFLLMMYYPSDLRSYVNRCKRSGTCLKVQWIVRIMKGIIKGIIHIRNHKIVHRDLHFGNIFVYPQFGRVWITDFGSCLDLRTNNSHNRVAVNKRKSTSFFLVHKDQVKNFGIGFFQRGKYCTLGRPPPEIRNFDPRKEDYLDFSKSDLYSAGEIGKKMLMNVGLDEKSSEEYHLLASLVELILNPNHKKRIGCKNVLHKFNQIKV